jgi:hypothetical protein
LSLTRLTVLTVLSDWFSPVAVILIVRIPNRPARPKAISIVLAVAAPRRYRNREHLRYVAQQACLICGRKQSDPHHIRYLQPRALGRKASDEFAVPLCRAHHRAVHRAGDDSRALAQTQTISC